MRVCPQCGTETQDERCPVDGLATLAAAVLSVQDPLLDRLVAGKYRVEAQIGSGGMGSVYRARHLETGGLVALKVMIPDRQNRPAAVKRFALEAQNAAALRHAHSVRVLDFGTDDELMYLVMEFLEGESLHALLERERRLPWQRAARIARAVAMALWEAHEHPRRIIHRDIKPANVFVCAQVGDDFIKVVDFGVARSLEGTGAGTLGAIGTPHAMAPEQWRGDADARSDLYAVGCLLFEMVAGRPPFVAGAQSPASSQLVALAAMHMHTLPAPLTRSAPTAPLGLARLAHALLEKDPDARPQSAAQVVELLDRVLDGDALDELDGPLARATAQQRPPSGARRSSSAIAVEDVHDDLETRDAAADALDALSLDALAADQARGDDATATDDDVAIVTPAPAPIERVALRQSAPRPRPGSGGSTPVAPSEAKQGAAPTAWLAWGIVAAVLVIALAFAWQRGLLGGRAEAADAVVAPTTVAPPPPPRVNVAEPSAAGAAALAAGPGSPDEGGAIADEGVEAPRVVYRAHLSAADHRSSKGSRLRHAADVIVQDRENLHSGRHRDSDDGFDSVFSDSGERGRLRRLVAKGLSRDLARTIVDGEPLIEVLVFRDSAQIALLRP